MKIPVPSFSLIGWAAAIALVAGAAGGWKLGASHWHSKYQDIRVEFADYKAKGAETQLTSFRNELKAWRENDEKQEAILQTKVRAALARATTFQKRLQEAERADPQLADCLMLPVPNSLRDSPSEARTAAGSDSLF